MRFKWVWGEGRTELKLVTPGAVHTHGYLEVFENGLTRNGTFTKTRVYNIRLHHTLTTDMLDCELVDYVSLRKAMRALKETVTVLIIGRGYEV